MQDEPSRLPARKAVFWSAVGCGGLLVIVAAVAGIAIWRINVSLDERKADVVALTNRFTDCFYRSDVKCAKALTTWDGNILDSLPAMSSQFLERLGTRGAADPVEESWSMKKFKSVTGATTTTILVRFDVAYTNDPHAVEAFEVVDDGGGLRVRNFRVSSPKLFADPRKAP